MENETNSENPLPRMTITGDIHRDIKNLLSTHFFQKGVCVNKISVDWETRFDLGNVRSKPTLIKIESNF